jgi:hypothetical protein
MNASLPWTSVLSVTASEMVCFSASVNARLGAAADSAVGSMGSSKSDIHPVSKLEARIIAKFRLLISYLDPVMPGMEQAGERGLLGTDSGAAIQWQASTL